MFCLFFRQERGPLLVKIIGLRLKNMVYGKVVEKDLYIFYSASCKYLGKYVESIILRETCSKFGIEILTTKCCTRGFLTFSGGIEMEY